VRGFTGRAPAGRVGLGGLGVDGAGGRSELAAQCGALKRTLRARRRHMTDSGKPTRVALIAIARKPLIHLNATFRDNEDYRRAAAWKQQLRRLADRPSQRGTVR
jgi:hypothetical protein